MAPTSALFVAAVLAALGTAQEASLNPTIQDEPVFITGNPVEGGGIGISLSAGATLSLGDGGLPPASELPTADLPTDDDAIPVTTLNEPDLPIETVTETDLPASTITATEIDGTATDTLTVEVPGETTLLTSATNPYGSSTAEETSESEMAETTSEVPTTTMMTKTKLPSPTEDEAVTSMTTETVSPVPEEPETVSDSGAAPGAMAVGRASTVLGLVALIPAFFL